jgi:hypothetical protein
MTESFIIIAYAIVGGLWRRVLGGWLNWNRAVAVIFGSVFALPFVLVLPHWAWLIPLEGAILAYWTIGHKWDHVLPMLKRYGPIGLWWRGAILWWPEKWNKPPFIDGPVAVAEIGAGATFFGIIGGILAYML